MTRFPVRSSLLAAAVLAGALALAFTAPPPPADAASFILPVARGGTGAATLDAAGIVTKASAQTLTGRKTGQFTLAAALGEATSALIAAKEAAEAEAAALRAEPKAKDATAQDLRTRISEMEADARAAAASDAGKLRADLAAKDANIQTLLAENEALRAGAEA